MGILAAVCAVLSWLLFVFYPRNRGPIGPAAIAFEGGIYLVMFVGLIGAASSRSVARSLLMVCLVSYLVIALAVFANLYWDYGTTKNFNQTLTHLDAAYFAIGTLGTAGTGNIYARSETIRAIQTGEMCLGIIALLGAVSAVMARLMESKRQRIVAN